MKLDENLNSQSSGESKDPGAARYGNFINYYTFNPPENRLRNIPDDLVSMLDIPDCPITVLDVGCNAGDLTAAMFHQIFKDVDVRMLGVDLDSQLVDRARDKFTITDRLEFRTVDLMADGSIAELTQWSQDHGGQHMFDLVTVFSVTMWIHLNHGDQGLVSFISRLCSLARFILVEPQPWKCYQTAARRMRKLGKEEFKEMKTLTMRGPGVDQDIVDVFLKEGMEIVRNFGESEWNRKLVLLKHKS